MCICSSCHNWIIFFMINIETCYLNVGSLLISIGIPPLKCVSFTFSQCTDFGLHSSLFFCGHV
uniref:Uncharacterized protein n=1 Tax=Nelumbo nucifera TaxID=4432 RepID=A0A822XQU6_NELNU|nr:TPA_asm: hypothetical protein HUJ06_024170 [Nelumbo nucifera]